MLGIEDYGSDAESSDESLKPSTSSLSSTSKPSCVPKSSSLSLSGTTSGTSKASGAAPPKQKRTKKIAIDLPPLPTGADDDDTPPAKKPRMTSNEGARSSLLSMLPAPKRPAPVIEKKSERVLGGGGGPGLVFRTSKADSESRGHGGEADVDADDSSAPSTTFLLPLSLKKGRTNVSLEDEASQRPAHSAAPPADFFSLGTRTPTPSATSSAPIVTSGPAISSAPAISTFRPPSPTLDDLYPGYYQLPSGAYAPYDASYYAVYAKKWQTEYEKHIRTLEKSQYDPETDDARDVDMAAEMEKARQEIKAREDRKALTAGKTGTGDDGEPAMPKMNVKGAKLGAVARSRHQLTTLLTEAYSNREALEERIAQGRRNRKEAGNKYGF